MIVIPAPLQLVMDDAGWFSGSDGSAYGEPYRTGFKRNHTLEDYLAIAKLGRALQIRLAFAMVHGRMVHEWNPEKRSRRYLAGAVMAGKT